MQVCLGDLVLPSFVYVKETVNVSLVRVKAKVDFVSNIKTSLEIEVKGNTESGCDLNVNLTDIDIDLIQVEGCTLSESCTYLMVNGSRDDINIFLEKRIQVKRLGSIESCDVIYQQENHEKQIVTITTDIGLVITVPEFDYLYTEEDIVEEGYLIFESNIKLEQIEYADSIFVSIRPISCGSLSNISLSESLDEFDEHEIYFDDDVVKLIKVTAKENQINRLNEVFLSKMTFLLEKKFLDFDCRIECYFEANREDNVNYFNRFYITQELDVPDDNNPTIIPLPFVESKSELSGVLIGVAVVAIAMSVVLTIALVTVSQNKKNHTEKEGVLNPMRKKTNIDNQSKISHIVSL